MGIDPELDDLRRLGAEDQHVAVERQHAIRGRRGAQAIGAQLEAWYPGIRGAEALANILTGQVNPTGKLAITFPRSDADLPHPALVLPPPESQPARPAPGADISAFMALMAKGLPAFQTYYDEKLKVGYAWYDA